MTYILILILIFSGLAYLYANQNKINPDSESEVLNTVPVKINKASNLKTNDSLSYSQRLQKTKEFYPFKNWRENFFEYEMEQYTQENCDAAKYIFDELIDKLIEAGENADEKSKLQLFEKALKSLNRLSEKEEALIETGEREDLCELIDKITIASGLKPEDYADGEGIADLWREW